MDDCNLQSGLRLLRYLLVQIPLWTIVTICGKMSVTSLGRSDSSMDDCNDKGVTIFGDRFYSSDSSMDDCNVKKGAKSELVTFVQIPLWTIVTGEEFK